MPFASQSKRHWYLDFAAIILIHSGMLDIMNMFIRQMAEDRQDNYKQQTEIKKDKI